MTAVLSHSGFVPSSEARVEYARCSVARSVRFVAYCITGRYEGIRSVSLKPLLPAAAASARAARSTSSGTPARSSAEST